MKSFLLIFLCRLFVSKTCRFFTFPFDFLVDFNRVKVSSAQLDVTTFSFLPPPHLPPSPPSFTHCCTRSCLPHLSLIIPLEHSFLVRFVQNLVHCWSQFVDPCENSIRHANKDFEREREKIAAVAMFVNGQKEKKEKTHPPAHSRNSAV